ncbi:hypothetical protein RFI_09207, partial [Reticulomyxa filosa]
VYFVVKNRYVKLCQVCSLRIPPTLFLERFLPKLLSYADDRISNVRCSLARLLSTDLLKNEKYASREDVKLCVNKLKNDKEDVEVKRFFATEKEIEAFLQKQQSPAIENTTETQTDTADPGGYSSSEDYDESGGEGAEVKETANNQEVAQSNGNEDATVKTEEKPSTEVKEDVDTKKAPQSKEEQEQEVEKQLVSVDIQQPLQRQTTLEDEKEAAKNTASYADSKQKGEDFNTTLIHQPTPYRLPGLDDQSDTDSEDEDNGQEDDNDEDTPANKPSVGSIATDNVQVKHSPTQEVCDNM